MHLLILKRGKMLASSLLSFLALAATTAVASPITSGTTPAAPPTEYLFTVNITSSAPTELGETPAGQRAFQPISGGIFSGPRLEGKSDFAPKSWGGGGGLFLDLVLYFLSSFS